MPAAPHRRTVRREPPDPRWRLDANMGERDLTWRLMTDRGQGPRGRAARRFVHTASGRDSAGRGAVCRTLGSVLHTIPGHVSIRPDLKPSHAMPLSLTPPGARDAGDVPTALRTAAATSGHRPAITLLAPPEGGRQEQSFTSLAQWAAKTAHWIALELLLEPGDRLGIVGPPGWVPAAAALGAWWAGLTVVVGPDAPGADVVLAHVDGVPSVSGDLAVWGWGFDGAPTTNGPADAFVELVQPFPDDPPAPLGTAPSPALDDGSDVATQAAMLDALRDAAAETVGVEGTSTHWLGTVALRPLVTGRPTVVLGPGVHRAEAEGDRVSDWVG